MSVCDRSQRGKIHIFLSRGPPKIFPFFFFSPSAFKTPLLTCPKSPLFRSRWFVSVCVCPCHLGVLLLNNRPSMHRGRRRVKTTTFYTWIQSVYHLPLNKSPCCPEVLFQQRSIHAHTLFTLLYAFFFNRTIGGREI